MSWCVGILRAMRPHQWLKNTLIFIPLIASGHYRNLEDLLWLSVGFVVFSLLASSVYIVNDIFDIESDRHHPTKKKRPFASGIVSIKSGIVLTALLLGASGTLGLVLLPFPAVYLGVVYVALTCIYTLLMKKLIIADAVVLGILYTLRIVFGALIIDTGLSFWIFSFSLFCFTGLAFMKRVIEINGLDESIKGEKAKGRGYQSSDKGTLEIIGVALSFVSVLVFCLYLNDVAVSKRYTHGLFLWAVVPALIYWHARVWLLVDRGQVHDDPVVFAAKDAATWFVLGYGLAIILLAGN